MNPKAFAVLVALVAYGDLTKPDEAGSSTNLVASSPQVTPPPPPSAIPAPPRGQVTAPAPGATPALPAGQWVFTSQYGWVFLPYGSSYTSVLPDARLAWTYGYGPTLGWSWLSAPWIFGLGVTPYWGPLGPRGFGWYGPYFRAPLVFRPWPHFRSHGWYRGGGRGHR